MCSQSRWFRERRLVPVEPNSGDRIMERQAKTNHTAPAGSIPKPDPPLVSRHDGPADGETEPDAAVCALGPLAAIELLEDSFLVALSYARTVVAHLDQDSIVFSPRNNLYGGRRSRMADDVFEQIHEYLLDENRIERDERDVLTN